MLSIVLLLELSLGCWANSTSCPVGFETFQQEHCFLEVGESIDFCDANHLCATEGVKRNLPLYLIGRNVDLLIKTKNGSRFYWTSINNFLRNGETMGTNQWYDGSNSTDAFSVHIENFVGKIGPVSAHGGTGTKYIIPDITKDKLVVICELGQINPWDNPLFVNVQKFQQDNTLRFETNSKDPSQIQGCFMERQVKSLMECLYKCMAMSVCRAAYHKPHLNRCRLILYVDARMSNTPMNKSLHQWQLYNKIPSNP